MTTARRTTTILAALLLAAAATPLPASAETIIDQWSSVKVPAPPALKAVKIDAKDTALLVLDFNGAQDPNKGPCNTKTKPRCIASLPRMEKFIAAARAAKVPVIYSITAQAEPKDIATALTPKEGDPIVKSSADKFVKTDLAEILTKRGIKTVIVTGTASEGAVLDTATHAALWMGMNIILPVDGMSSTEPYAEQYVAWHMMNAPGVSAKTTLTSIDQISF